MNKQTTLSKVYYDPSGIGSLNQTLSDAGEFDNSIKLDDARQWMEEPVKRMQQVYGQNSFVTNVLYHEYQLDLMYLSHSSRTNNMKQLGYA